MSKFDRAGFFVFVLVFVSRNFELGRNVSCEESTVSPARGYFLHLGLYKLYLIEIIDL